MINLALKKVAVGIALMGCVGAASAITVDNRTFNLGTLDTTLTQSNIDIAGSYDDRFNFTAGTLPAFGTIVGFDILGDLTAQYRFGLSSSLSTTAWSALAPVASDADGIFAYSGMLNGLTAGTSYSFEIRGSATESHYSVTLAPVPEPETYALLLAGLGMMGTIARRRKISGAA